MRTRYKYVIFIPNYYGSCDAEVMSGLQQAIKEDYVRKICTVKE